MKKTLRLWRIIGRSPAGNETTLRVRAVDWCEARDIGKARKLKIESILLIDEPATWTGETARRRIGGTYGT